MTRIILGPKVVGDWLEEMQKATSAAAAVGLEAEISGRIDGALMVNKDGQVMLLAQLKAGLSAEAAAALMGGAPVDVEGDLEVGWDREKKVGRAVFGYCEAKFRTKGMTDNRGRESDSG